MHGKWFKAFFLTAGLAMTSFAHSSSTKCENFLQPRPLSPRVIQRMEKGLLEFLADEDFDALSASQWVETIKINELEAEVLNETNEAPLAQSLERWLFNRNQFLPSRQTKATLWILSDIYFRNIDKFHSRVNTESPFFRMLIDLEIEVNRTRREFEILDLPDRQGRAIGVF